MNDVVRVPTYQRLSEMQFLVVALLSAGLKYPAIAAELKIKPETARSYAGAAARRIPGDLPTVTKCIMWFRGATRAMLEGRLDGVYILPEAVRLAREARTLSIADDDLVVQANPPELTTGRRSGRG